MKTPSAATLALAAAFAASQLAAATYDAASAPATLSDANGTVSFTYDGEGAITELSLAPGLGATLTLDGDELAFAAGANIVAGLGGSSIVSNSFTAAGALVFEGGDGLTWNGDTTYLPETGDMTIFSGAGIDVANLVPLACGGRAGNADVTDYKACFIDRLSDGTLVYEVQRFNNNATSPNTRGMLIAVANSGSDIKAKWLAGGYKDNLKVEGVERLFSYDANATYDNITGSANEGVITNNGYRNAKANQLTFATRGKLTFAVAGERTLKAVSGSGVDVTFDANAGGESATVFKSVDLAKNDDWQTLTTEYTLAELTLRSGYIAGRYVNSGSGLPAIAFGWTNDNTTAGCQLQCTNNYVRGVDILLRQNGDKVEIKRVRALYKDTGWEDFYGKKYLTTADTSSSQTPAQVSPLWVSTAPEGAVATITVSGANTMTDSSYVFKGDGNHPLEVAVAARDALPQADAYGAVDIDVAATGGYKDGICDDSAITLHDGATITQSNEYMYSYNVQHPLTLDASEYVATDNTSYLNKLVLANGASVSGVRVQAGYSDSSTCKWRVAGTGASTCDAPLTLLSNGNTVRTVEIEVEDTAEGADFIMNGDIKPSASRHTKGTFKKTGAGTMRVNGQIQLTAQPSRVEEGILELGVSNATAAEHSITLSGGALALAAGTANTAANVAVTADSTLSVGVGATLELANLTVADGATLTLSGAPAKKSLKVAAVLDAATLSRIVLQDGRAGGMVQDADGYVRERAGGLIISIH